MKKYFFTLACCVMMGVTAQAQSEAHKKARAKAVASSTQTVNDDGTLRVVTVTENAPSTDKREKKQAPSAAKKPAVKKEETGAKH